MCDIVYIIMFDTLSLYYCKNNLYYSRESKNGLVCDSKFKITC